MCDKERRRRHGAARLLRKNGLRLRLRVWDFIV